MGIISNVMMALIVNSLYSGNINMGNILLNYRKIGTVQRISQVGVELRVLAQEFAGCTDVSGMHALSLGVHGNRRTHFIWDFCVHIVEQQ